MYTAPMIPTAAPTAFMALALDVIPKYFTLNVRNIKSIKFHEVYLLKYYEKSIPISDHSNQRRSGRMSQRLYSYGQTILGTVLCNVSNFLCSKATGESFWNFVCLANNTVDLRNYHG